MPKLLNDVSGRTTEPAGAIVSAIAPVYEDESDAAVAAMRAAAAALAASSSFFAWISSGVVAL